MDNPSITDSFTISDPLFLLDYCDWVRLCITDTQRKSKSDKEPAADRVQLAAPFHTGWRNPDVTSSSEEGKPEMSQLTTVLIQYAPWLCNTMISFLLNTLLFVTAETERKKQKVRAPNQGTT